MSDQNPDFVYLPATRGEVERMIAEASASDLPSVQAMARSLRKVLDAAPLQDVFNFRGMPKS